MIVTIGTCVQHCSTSKSRPDVRPKYHSAACRDDRQIPDGQPYYVRKIEACGFAPGTRGESTARGYAREIGKVYRGRKGGGGGKAPAESDRQFPR